MGKLIMGLLLGLLLVGAGGIWGGHLAGWLPPGDDPFARLDLDAPPGAFTSWQLRRLRGDPATCLAVLTKAGIDATSMPGRPMVEGCGQTGVLRFPGEKARFRQPVTMTCAMVAGFVLFERHALIPAADRELTSRIARIEDMGTYNCRNIGNGPGGRRSEHATANAIDLGAFVTAAGQRITVKDDGAGTRRPGVSWPGCATCPAPISRSFSGPTIMPPMPITSTSTWGRSACASDPFPGMAKAL